MRVPIDFHARPTPLSGGIHGVEQGPAQYKLTRDSSGWRAKTCADVGSIEINETLHRRDVRFTIGHELDEIALIVRANPADDAAILAEGEASLFKPSSTSSEVTGHDRAAAREAQSGKIYNSRHQELLPVALPSGKSVWTECSTRWDSRNPLTSSTNYGFCVLRARQTYFLEELASQESETVI